VRAAVRGASRALERFECRECAVICERVVSPWRCLGRHSGCVYAYREGASTYFGCLYKVFSPELDMAAFDGPGTATSRADPYGVLRVVRPPRPGCPVTVESAYTPPDGREECLNPAFRDRKL
jgi:hypothetical protein